jgi:hypothetical protein
MMNFLKTEETLIIAADLKLGRDFDKKRKKSLVMYLCINAVLNYINKSVYLFSCSERLIKLLLNEMKL